MKNLILHIPHSSTTIPMTDGYVGSPTEIQNEILKLTDWYTDELFYSEMDFMIIAQFSRIFCDVERFENDADEVMAKVGMGATYERFDNGTVLRTITPALREHIMNEYYWKHHNHFTNVVKEKLAKEGSCLIVDCHSYPSTPVIRDLDQTSIRPDFNIGIDSFHTPPQLIEASINYFEQKGYSLGIDWPYSGTIVPMNYYQKNDQVHSIMLEINRKLYLEEPTNKKSKPFFETQQIVNGYLKMLRVLI
jgi:N-formylglutamate amidohydrolase